MRIGKTGASSRAALAACVALLGLNAAVHAQDQRVGEEHATQRTVDGAGRRQNPKAQSGAEAADEARIYTAQLRRCEGFSGTQRESCVLAAKRRLGQL